MNDKYIQIEGNKSLSRDTHTNAVINTNRNEYDQAVKRKMKKLNDAKRLDLLEDKVDKILKLLEEKNS